MRIHGPPSRESLRYDYGPPCDHSLHCMRSLAFPHRHLTQPRPMFACLTALQTQMTGQIGLMVFDES